MTTVLLVIHIMIALALVGVILLQRSEGGALGIGGGGGGFMTGRSAGNALTKTTAMLAAAFFATSLSLTLDREATRSTPTSIFNQAGTPVQGGGVAARPRAPVGASSTGSGSASSSSRAGGTASPAVEIATSDSLR